MLTITSNINDEEAQQGKDYLILTARVHPGEANSSYMMEGIIDFLLCDSEEAQEIRQTLIIKVIPMSNPDGVVSGNYRTGICGNDLNRVYHNPDYRLHPTVHAIKELVADLSELDGA